MEIRDYLRMLRRGWPALLVITALFLGLAAAYLAVAPRRYQSTAVLFVSAADPRTLDDLSQAADLSATQVSTYAAVVDSVTVLGPAASRMRPQGDPDELVDMVSTTVRLDTTLIDVTATASSAARAAAVANAAAQSATRVLPALESPITRPLIKVQQIQEAAEPSTAVSPDPERVLAVAFIVGLCVGLAAVIAAQTLDTRLRRAQDLRKLTDVPLLGAIPRLTRSQRQGVLVRDDPYSTAGEAFRRLRTNMRTLEVSDRRSLVFTAVTGSREGGRITANIAWSLAQAGRRVVLVDLDLRHSTVGDALGVAAGPGLADVLTEAAPLADVVRSTKQDRLSLVLSGTPQRSPSELLSAPALATVLRQLEREYEYVILHAPPLLSFTDAAVVSGVASGTLLTVAAGRTRAQDLLTALTVLATVQVKPVGLVLTRATEAISDQRKVESIRTRLRARPGRTPLEPVSWDWDLGAESDDQAPRVPGPSPEKALDDQPGRATR